MSFAIILVIVALVLTIIRLLQAPGLTDISALLVELYLLAPEIQKHL